MAIDLLSEPNGRVQTTNIPGWGFSTIAYLGAGDFLIILHTYEFHLRDITI